MKKKLLATLLAGVMTLGLAACGSGNDSNDSGDGQSSAGSYSVGVCQFMQHAALDAATKG